MNNMNDLRKSIYEENTDSLLLDTPKKKKGVD